jgi:MFS family permease
MIPLGASSMAFVATLNATLQLNSNDDMRGRVMALYFVVFLGSTPIGAPIVGWIAQQFNPRVALGMGGVATLGACAYGWARLKPLLTNQDQGLALGTEDELAEARAERLLQERA